LAVVSDGRVFAWGGNAQGQLGLGTFGADQLSPVVIQGLTGVRSVAGGNEYSLAVKQDGTVAAWGLGGQLGDGSTARRRWRDRCPA
jgi:alpha-tubulin suppressor-like RCC1 family protein